MWSCNFCQKKNNNSARKCHGKLCKGTKPEEVIKQEQKNIVRDFCPKCLDHQDFFQTGKKRFKCPRCKRTFKFSGKPVPEIKKDMIVT